MSELSPEDRALVDRGGRDDAPDPGARDRVRHRLAVRLGVAAGLGTASVATKSATAATATAGGAGLAVKVVAIVAVVAALGGGGAALVASRHEAATTTTTVPTTIATTPTRQAPTAALGSADTPPNAAPAEARVAAAPSSLIALPPSTAQTATPTTHASPTRMAERGGSDLDARGESGATTSPGSPGSRGGQMAAPAPPSDALAEETRLLREANAATRAGDPNRALALLDEHARRFPGGVLGEEREAERILALCAVGRVADARAAAARFLASRPRSPLAGRIRTSCGAP